MIHDCIYQFLRIFYHSRFKPQQLEMTATQLLAPVLDFALTLPLIMRLMQDISQFSSATKIRIESKPEVNKKLFFSYFERSVSQVDSSEELCNKFLLYSHIYLSSMSCLIDPDGNVRLATLYQAKMLRKNLDSEIKARDA